MTTFYFVLGALSALVILIGFACVLGILEIFKLKKQQLNLQLQLDERISDLESSIQVEHRDIHERIDDLFNASLGEIKIAKEDCKAYTDSRFDKATTKSTKSIIKG